MFGLHKSFCSVTSIMSGMESDLCDQKSKEYSDNGSDDYVQSEEMSESSEQCIADSGDCGCETCTNVIASASQIIYLM